MLLNFLKLLIFVNCSSARAATNILLLLLLLHSPDLQAETRERLTNPRAQFETAFDIFSKQTPKPKDWLSSSSPWSPLLTRQFHHALSEEDKQRSLVAQSLGQCEPVISAEIQGFYAMYPDLRAILSRDDIRANFEEVLLPNFSHALKRCRAHEILIPILEQTKRKYSHDETYPVALPRAYVLEPEPFLISNDEQTYSNAVRDIFRLGLCNEFAPALEDIVWFETEIRTYQLKLENLIWLESKLSTSPSLQHKLKQWRSYLVKQMRTDGNYYHAESLYSLTDGDARPPLEFHDEHDFCSDQIK